MRKLLIIPGREKDITERKIVFARQLSSSLRTTTRRKRGLRSQSKHMSISTIKYYPLTGSENWILWKLEPVNGRLSKIPYSARYNGKASTADRSSWTDFRRAKALLDSSTAFNGLGFVFSKEDGFVFIDIDHCIEDGEISETGRDILSHFQNSYIEVSQSGAGIHIISRGTIPKAMKRAHISGRYQP